MKQYKAVYIRCHREVGSETIRAFSLNHAHELINFNDINRTDYDTVYVVRIR